MEDYRRDDQGGLDQDIGGAFDAANSIAKSGMDYARRAKDAQTAQAQKTAASAAQNAAQGATSAGAGASAWAASAASNGAAAASGEGAAGAAATAGADAAGTGASASTAGASSAAGPAALAATVVIQSIAKFLTDEETRKKVAVSASMIIILITVATGFISSTRDAVSLDPLERGIYSAYDEDCNDYPTEDEAMQLALQAINEGIAESYNRTMNNIDASLETQKLDPTESKASTDYTDLNIVQYNPYKILAAYDVIYGHKDYTPEKLKAIIASANLYPYTFGVRIPITKQNLYMTKNTPIDSINEQAWDEPIDVPKYDSNGDEIDWYAISEGQDWEVISDNGASVTIGMQVETEYATIQITRFDEKEVLKAIGYDDDIMGDKYIEPDYSLPEAERARGTTATYFDNYRQMWLWAERFRTDESTAISTELAMGGITVEANITEEEKANLIEYCNTIAKDYEEAIALESQGMGFFQTLLMEIENIVRPYVKEIQRVEPTAEKMREYSERAKALKAEISTWSTSENPSAMPVSQVQIDDAIDEMYALRDAAFYTLITNTQRKSIFKATRMSINILDGAHFMKLDAYIDPLTGEMVAAEYGLQNVDIKVTGEMSEKERSIRQQIIDKAKTYLGTAYSTLDCSHFVRKVFNGVFGSKASGLEAVAAGQGKYCVNAHVTIDQSGLRPGDLIFWAFKNKSGTYKRPDRFMHISHVGIYAGDGMIIDSSSVNGKVVYRRLISQSSIVMCGAPLYAITGLDPHATGVTAGGGTGTPGASRTESNVPSNIRRMDTHSVLKDYDAIDGTVHDRKIMNVRYYCGCEKCKFASQNVFGENRTVGSAAMSKAAAMAFMRTTETDEDDNDPLGTIVCIDGELYKCDDYSVGEYQPQGDTIMVYTDDHHEAVQKNYKQETKAVTIYRYGQ